MNHTFKSTDDSDLEERIKVCYFCKGNTVAHRKSYHDRRGSTLTSEEDENARKPNLYPDHMHEDMQTEAAPHETQAESNESVINEENTYEEKVETPSVTGDQPDEGMEAEPADSLKDTKEEITHKEKVESPITLAPVQI
ncbi:hypothetical protein F8M41_010702 [Gigaspora margarita]|uniref:Uncharacterized protein n=1 Tax=Gigaspora margarita TaxID=4874 RepID=A0A8H3X208_GIGMA|nr:hypothetical protein F8M41_010702 [Gigaspora margarita]